MTAEGTFPKINGDVLYASEVNDFSPSRKSGDLFKNVAQLLYNADYIGFNSKLNLATGSPSLKNLKYDVFSTGSAYISEGMVYSSTDKLYATDISVYFIMVEATSLSSTFTDNDCVVERVADNRWVIYCTTGTDNVKKAKLYKTLFYGTNGTDARIARFSTITNILTNITELNGYQVTYLSVSKTMTSVTANNHTSYYTGTFTDTTTNSSCQSWSSLSSTAGHDSSASWANPTGNTLNTETAGSSDELGTDLTADIQVNPATCRLSATVGWTSETSSAQAIVIHKGNMTLALTEDNVESTTTASYTNFVNSGFILLSSEAVRLIFKTISLPTITDCIATWNSLIDSDNTLVVSISTNGTNYETVTDTTLHRFSNTGTNLYIRFVITRVDTVAIDKVSEYAIWYNTGAV